MPLPSNKEVLRQMELSRVANHVTTPLLDTFQAVVKHEMNKAKYLDYQHLCHDIESQSMLELCKSWSKFKPALSDKPIAYFNIIVCSACLQVIQQDRTANRLKDQIECGKQ